MFQKEKSISLLIILTFFFTCGLCVSCLLKVRFSYPIKAIYQEENQVLEILWPYEKIDEIIKIEKWKQNEIEHPFEIINISEIEVDEINKINYQTIEIKCEEKLIQNQIVPIVLLDKKEKLIKKIIKIVKELL